MISLRGTLVTIILLAAVAAPMRAQFPTDPPPPMPLAPLEFPPFQEAQLDNGLTLLVVEDHRLPIVSIRLSMLTGARDEPAGFEGLAGMAGELLTKGTERRTAEEIAEEIEGVGASLNASAGSDFFSMFTTVLTEHVELGFDLLSDVLLNPTFPESELELAQTRMLSALRLEKSSPGALASRYFGQSLYGEHPYGRQPSEESVESMTRTAVTEWAATHLKPAGGLLVLAGDISLDQGRRLANRFLGSWTGSPPAPRYAQPPTRRGTEILLIHRPGSDQSNIRVGNLALKPGDDTYYGAVVANKILGGGADARLFMVLREEKGWTYGAYSSVTRPKDVGTFQANTEVRTPVTDSALVELMGQVRRMRTEPVPDSELAAAKGYLVGSFPLSIQTPQQIASQVANVRLLGLGENYLRTYRQRLDAVSPDDARRAAEIITKPDSAVIVVVGDGQAIYDKLTAIAPVTIIDVDGNPLTPAELTPTATTLMIDLSQIVSRRDSMQISAQGMPVGYLVREVSRANGSATYTENLSIAAFGMTQNLELTLDLEPLAMGTVDQTVEFRGQSAETHLEYGAASVKGTAQSPEPTGTIKTLEIDTTLVEGTVDDNTLTMLIPALALADGATFTVNVFESSEGSAKPYTLAVRGTESVTVPAGTFDTFKVESSGGAQPFVFYVTQEAPRRLVKIEIVGQPVSFELAN